MPPPTPPPRRKQGPVWASSRAGLGFGSAEAPFSCPNSSFHELLGQRATVHIHPSLESAGIVMQRAGDDLLPAAVSP